MGGEGMSREEAAWELLRTSAAARLDGARARELLARLGPEPEWQAILELARKHGMTPLLARTLENAGAIEEMPAGAREELKESCKEHLFFSLRMTAELGRICGRFAAAGLEAAAVKGPVLAQQAFGASSLRQYADLDIVVRQRDAARATRMLLEDGYAAEISEKEAAGENIPGQYCFWRENPAALVELHTERTLRYFVKGFPVEEFFARRENAIVDGQSVPALSAEDTLVFICVHGSKHFWERLMWIADVAGFAARRRDLDWRKVFAVARKTGTERMVRLGLLLAADVLSAELPEAAMAEARANRVAARLAGKLGGRIFRGEEMEAGALRRARMRAWMCGGGWRGAAFLLRLLFTPTEEDWSGEGGNRAAGWGGVPRRPLRLARKYGGGRTVLKK
jgi:hypothetical protein